MRKSRVQNTKEKRETLQAIFQNYWREELKEAEEAVQKTGQLPVPAMSERLRREKRRMGGVIRKGVLFAGKACAILFLCVVMVLAVNEDARAWTWTFMSDPHVEYVNFRTHPDLRGEMEWAERHELEYVPEGYRLWRKKHDDLDGSITYIAPDNEYLLHFHYFVNRQGTHANADNTDIQWTTTRLADGTQAQMGVCTLPAGEYGPNYIIWSKDGYLYELAGIISTEELQKMAEGVRRLE